MHNIATVSITGAYNIIYLFVTNIFSKYILQERLHPNLRLKLSHWTEERPTCYNNRAIYRHYTTGLRFWKTDYIRWNRRTTSPKDPRLTRVHNQSQANYNELELQFKSISSNFIGGICLQAHSYLAWHCLSIVNRAQNHSSRPQWWNIGMVWLKQICGLEQAPSK